MGRCVRERRAMILGQKVAAERPSSSQVRVHQPDKARTGAEKIQTIAALRFLAAEAHPPKQRRKNERDQKPKPQRRCKTGWTRGQQGSRHATVLPPDGERNSSIQESFFDTACPFRFSIGKIEAGRFSMTQMKLAGVTGRCYLGLDYVSVTVFRMNPQNE